MGLFRTAARASVATRVVGNTRRRQEKRWAAEDAAAQAASGSVPVGASPESAAPTSEGAPAAADVAIDARIEQLQKLGALRDAGVLTEAEFEAEKRKVLGDA